MSQTPRTDAALVEVMGIVKGAGMTYDPNIGAIGRLGDFARQLERELAEAQRDADRYRYLRGISDLTGRDADELDAEIDAIINGEKL